MKLRRKVYILILVLCAALMAAEDTIAAPANRSATLQRLRVSKSPQKDAAAAAKTNPEQSAELALDLIFYDWICAEFGNSPDVPNLAAIVKGLASSASPAVDWARANLAVPDLKFGNPGHAPQRGELIDRLKDARAAILQTVGRRDNSPASAVNNLTSAYEVFEELVLELAGAEVLRERGSQRLAIGQYRLAEADYEQSLWIYTGYGCEVKAADALAELGALNMRLSRFSEAHRKFLSAAHKWLARGDGSRACRFFIRAGQALAAMGRQEEAQAAMMVGYREGSSWAVANKSYVWLAEDLLEMGRMSIEWEAWADARDLLIDADKWARHSGDARLRAKVLAELAPVWIEATRHASLEGFTSGQAKAQECLRTREGLLKAAIAPGTAALAKISSGESIPVADRRKLATDLSTAGWGLEELGQHKQAANMYEQSGILIEMLGKQSDRAQALWNAAKACEEAGEIARSTDLHRKAATAARLAGTRAMAAQILVDLAFVYTPSDPDSALKVLQEASIIAQEGGIWRDYALIQQKRAVLLAERKEYREAELHLSAACQRYLAFVGEPWTYAEMVIDLASIYKAMGAPEREMTVLADAANRIESWAEYEGINPAENQQRSELLFSLYSRLLPLEVDASKTENVDDRLRKASRQGWAQVMARILESDDDLSFQEVVRNLMQEQKEPPPAIISGRLAAQGWPAVLKIAWQLADTFPHLTKSVAIDVAEVYKHRYSLPEKLSVVEYLVGDNSVYAFILGRDEAFCRQINIERNIIDSSIRALRNSLIENEERVSAGIPVPPVRSWRLADISGESLNRDELDLRGITGALLELGNIFVEPIRGELTSIERIAVVPPADMAGVPFHAFASDSDGSIRFLIQDMEVCYVPPMMFADLVGPSRILKNGIDRVLVFADPLQNLQGAAAEAEAIRQSYRESEIYVGRMATKEQFRKAASSASVLHIAAHYKPDANPGRFSIDLAPGPGGVGTIGVEELCEIINPKLAMVVLSACETAGSAKAMLASTAQAAEILSLTGAPTIVGAFWKVSDKGSVKLMSEMYRELWDDKAKATALRNAQIAMISSAKGELAHPYYWAGFALFGNPD